MLGRVHFRVVQSMAVTVCLLMLAACSSTHSAKKTYPLPLHPVSEVLKKDLVYPIDVHDPWEGFNRRMFKFNYTFDKYLFLPIVNTYEFITPDIVEKGVSNIFSNLEDIRNLLNSAFQLKGKTTGTTGMRLLTNTTVGVGGLWDPATRWGFHRQEEDFGQTLGHYDVGEGPYLVLPIFGPSNVRDGVGLLADSAIYYAIDPVNVPTDRDYQGVTTGAKAVDTRHNIAFRYFETGSPFEYEMVRFLYFKKRQLDISK
jgi:phospholipid-binding lipoprotein MlaA